MQDGSVIGARASAGRAPAERAPHLLACAGLLLLAAALRLWDLGGPSFWYDEAYTWWVSTQVSPAASIESSLTEFIPPLTYFLWRGWAALTGTSEFALRAVVALLGLLTVALAGRIARRLVGVRVHGAVQRRVTRPAPKGSTRGVALAALALFAVAPPVLWAARDARMYGFVLAFTLLADLALLEALASSGRRRRVWAWVWGVAVLAALYTVVLAGFWLVGQGVFVLCALVLLRRGEARRDLVVALAPPAIVAGSLFLPWLIPAVGRLGENAGYWPGTLPATAFFARTVRGVTVFRFLASERAALHVGLLVTVFGLLAPVLAGRRLLAWIYPFATGVVPLVLMSVIFRHMPKWELQHTVIFAPSLLLALAMGWRASEQRSAAGARWGAGRRAQRDRAAERVPRRRLALGIQAWPLRVALLLAVSPLVVASVNLLVNPAFANDDWRGVAAYVEELRGPGDLVIVETGAALPAWTYYAGAAGTLPLPDDALLDVTHVLHYENTAPVLNAQLAGVENVWLVGWLDAVTDPTGVVAALLAEVGEPSPQPAFRGVSLRRYALTREPNFPAAPELTAAPEAELLPGVGLKGVTLPATPRPADEVIPVRTWWATADPGAHEGLCYQASLRIYDGAGDLWGQRDAPPGGGDYRPERWPADTWVLGSLDVRLPAGTPVGTYTATLILYELGGARSPELTLGTLRLRRPGTPPAMPEDMAAALFDGGAATGELPLTLLGARTARSAVAPCETLEGWLFWEVGAAVGPAEALYRVRLGLGHESAGVPLTPDFDLRDWQPGDRFMTQFDLPVSCRALATEAPLTVALEAGRGGAPAGPLAEAGSRDPDPGSERGWRILGGWLGPTTRIAVQRLFAVPEGVQLVSVEFGDGLAALVGFALEPAVVDAGTPFTLVLYWQAGQETDVPYTVFVHVTPPESASPVLAQDDTWPAGRAKPTYTWVPREVIADPHSLPRLAPGVYAVRVGLYGPDGVRVPASVAGERVQDDAVVLTTLVID